MTNMFLFDALKKKHQMVMKLGSCLKTGQYYEEN